MSVWVRAVVRNPIRELDRESLHSGIAKRLALLTYLFCPEEEEEPEVLLRRLTIEDVSETSGSLVWLLRYRANSDAFIRLERWRDTEMIRGEAEELEEFLENHRGAGLEDVRALLRDAKESFALELKTGDLNSMGWPLAIAAAAHLAEAGQGLLQADGSGWMRPTEREVTWLAEE
jgi:hypothetical protein